MASKAEKLDQIRNKILEAAAQRFQRFGYGKTNVAEIACDCGMSAGNLYRYFKNKAQIAEAIMRMSLERALAELKSVLKIPDLSATQRLEEYLLQELYFTHHQLTVYPTLIDQIRDPDSQGPMLGHEYIEDSRKILKKILQSGVESGEFLVENLEETAHAIQTATTKFRYPQLYTTMSLEDLEASAKQVIGLILGSISVKKPTLTATAAE